ncbi:hypothetical protein FNV43_RR08003 [Rhamnella rubrinervis]|uniref:Uncharacterized protein n=1 Tax=Rhamnella rubrinervis TaxID=2594499 RepID=A0A8K0HFQ4_9ROSA|nr:hypothetical protein FNV43_RR08003 [Rhamnella rubrinervis]
MDLKINQLNEDPFSLRLLHDFEFFEHLFLSPYSVNPNALDDKKLVQVYHSDHINAEAMVNEMMDIENLHDNHKEDEQCDATTKSVVATTCGGVNGSNNNELELDFLLVDPKYLEFLDEVLNTSGAVVTQEGEAGYGRGDSTLINDNELIDFDMYLENVLDEETPTQELIHNATDQTEAVSKINNTGCENNVKGWKTRKRLKKGTPEFAQRKEKYKLMNRVAAAKSFERKQHYSFSDVAMTEKARETDFLVGYSFYRLTSSNSSYRFRSSDWKLHFGKTGCWY